MSTKRYEKAFISYVDDNGEIKDGIFSNVIKTDSYVEFDTDKHRISLPWSRILKVKGPKEGGV